MGMFKEFFAFEMRFRLKSISTYVYFILWFAFSFLCVASESFGPIANGNGKVLLNGPYAITYIDIYSTLFGLFVIAAIFGTSVLRDFQRDTYQLLFTKPISKFAYLGGRWAGSFVITILIYTGMMIGTYLGTLAPWADHARIGPNHLWWYVQPFLSIVVLQVFFCGSLFFMVAALTRKIFIVYLQGVALFMVYVIGITVFSATRSLEHFWSGILDPVGLLLTDAVSRYWSVAEKNTLLMPWDFSGYSPGVFLYNRLLWPLVGLVALLVTWALFPMSVEALTAKSQGKKAARAREHEEVKPRVRSLAVVRLPQIQQVFGRATTWAQYWSLTGLRTRLIFREIPFWAIVCLLVVLALNNGYFAGRFAGQTVYPVTYLMLQAVEGNATLFLIIVAALYAAELIWRERDTRFSGIHDALPIPDTIDWLSKLTAICLAELALLTMTMVCGILMQTILGYHRYELVQYFEELYLIVFPQMVGMAMFAMFVQTIVSNKFIGHGIVIGSVVLTIVLFAWGLENTLYLPGTVPTYQYSDMNGYGHFVPSIAWSLVYWTSVFALLGVISIAYTRRGAEDSLMARTRVARQRAPGLALAAGAFLVASVASGGWYYYNTHVLNEFVTGNEQRRRQAAYEQSFKKYENLPQPKVTAVDTTVNIYPDRRSFDATGSYTLQNKTTQPISQIHITDSNQAIRELKFDRPFHLVSTSPQNAYSIYALEQPLAPGDTLHMSFTVGHTSKGFRDAGKELAQFAESGTFFDADFFPGIGYNSEFELGDPRRRREFKLGPLTEMAARGDPVQSRVNLFTPNSDWITYHTVVSTSADEIAIAPGYPVRDWTEGNRHYYEYSMGSTHILDFFAYLSGHYAVRKDVYQATSGPVNLEVYYDPAHAYNVAEMLSTARDGIKYYEANFSPFQFKQFRIMEFPRYRDFAQSFPNTVPFSEGIGFITQLEKPTDVDLTYFVTAHELGHQWWAHQLIGGRVEGSNMMSETLAQYSAYMLMEQKFGKDYMHRVMHHWLDRYLRGRAGEIRRERPLALVQRESYVWYEKGGQIMYTLADYIGADKVNLALHNFLMQYRYANADNQQDAIQNATGAAAISQPYPDTRMLVEALRAQTPPEYQYFIDDSFNHIVLYDNRTLSAKSKKRPDGKYEVTLEVQARKVQADGNGTETPMPLADYMDIGVFNGAKDEEKPLYMHREKITQEHSTFTVVVDSKPTRAGIDPYNKLIDRIPDDNMIDVTE